MSDHEGEAQPAAEHNRAGGTERRPHRFSSSIPPPSKLVLSSSGMQTKWKRFKRAWTNYEVATRLSDETKEYRCAVFMTCIGEEANELFDGFSFTNTERKNDIDTVIKKFDDFFVGETNEVYEAYVFNNRVQETAESIDTYIAALRQLAKTCNFENQEDRMIRDRIVVGVKDDDVRQKLLEVKGLTLQQCVDTCRAHESSRAKAHIMTKTEDQKVHKIKKSKHHSHSQKYKDKKTTQSSTTSSNDRVVCTRCARKHDKGKCPAYGMKCLKCSKLNHFAACCRSSKKNVHVMHEDDTDSYTSSESESESESNIHIVQRQDTETEEQEIFVDALEISSDTENDDVYVDAVEYLTSVEDNQLFVTVDVENITVKFKVDTGAQGNVLPLHTYNSLHNKPSLNKTKTRLTSFTGGNLSVKGTCTLNVMGEELKFYVVDTNQPALIGLASSRLLRLIQICSVDADTVDKDFPTIFGELGNLGTEYHIVVDESVKPVIQPPRKVPFALRERIKEELDRMEKLGVIEPQEGPTDWVSSMVVVEKPDKTLRVCMDPKDLNKAIKREHFAMPTVDEVTAQLEGAELFTKLDAQNGFWQIPLDAESSKLCCMQTPFGRYVFKRLPMGLACSSEVFHKTIKAMFSDIPRVDNWVDDILIWGRNQTEHDEALNAALRRANDRNLTLKRKKCEFAQTEIKYIGHIIGKDGIKPDPDKIAAIQNMPSPQSKADLQRFLGMVNYLGKFVSNMAELTAPLRTLLKKEVCWQWNHEQEQAFKAVKKQLTKAPILAHYSTDKPVKITADSSSVGLGCALMQDDRPVAYASRALTQAEQNYAQIEKETLAIVFACEKFHQYIYGKQCEVETDHKPIENIWKKPLNKCPPRIQRLMLRLQRYDLNITYKPGKEMYVADTLSRASVKTDTQVGSENEEMVKIHVATFMNSLPVADNRKQEMREETDKDPELKKLKEQILKGFPADKYQVDAEIRQYFQYNEELSVIDGIIFKADKILIPKSMRKEMLGRIHEGHLGMEKCKNRARVIFFWPGMSSQIEDIVSSCSVCAKHRNKQQKEPMISHEIPDRPWKKVGTDLFAWNDRDYLLIADYHSKFVEYALLPDTKSKTVIKHMKSIFARQGIPEEVVSDNGPQYSSEKFAEFARKWEFKHTTSSPTYPQSNGLAERMVQTLKKLFQKAKDSGEDVYLALLNYRTTPISSTLPSPAEILMNRKLRTRLDINTDRLKTKGSHKVKKTLKERQSRQKQQYDKTAKSLPTLHKDDKVYISDKGKWRPATVVKHTDTPRSYLVQTDSGTYRRNRRDLLKVSTKSDSENTPIKNTAQPERNNSVPQIPGNQNSVPQTTGKQKSMPQTPDKQKSVPQTPGKQKPLSQTPGIQNQTTQAMTNHNDDRNSSSQCEKQSSHSSIKSKAQTSNTPTQAPSHMHAETPKAPVATRSGRIVRIPVKMGDYV